jgi:hypothetical protein
MFFYSCNSQKKSKIEDEKQKTEYKTTISQPFDLAYLTLNENINDILTAVNLSKKDTINADFTTLLGNEKLVFGSDKVLIFNGEKLSGENSLGTNNVIFHYGKIDKEIGPLYNEKEDVVGMCQINLYDETTSTKLLNSLYLKLNKPNDIYILKPIKSYLWIKNNICYFYFTKDTDDFYRVLFIFKKNDNEWANFISHLGFGISNLKFNN